MMFSILILILIVIAVGASSTVVIKRKQTATTGGNRFFSVSSMAEKLSLLAKRFPVSVLLIVGLSVLFFMTIDGGFDEFPERLWIFFPIATFLSVTATLFFEDFLNNLKTCALSLLAVALWGVYCFFLPENIDDIQIAKVIEVFVISGTAFLAMFFISFLKKNSDRAFWNFAMQILSQMALAAIFGAILFGGLALALLAVDSLFNVAVDEKIYGYLAVICLALFSPIYFLANIPNKTVKYDNETVYSKALKILALYILTPILAVYTVILYAYLFKIIFTWELPNGWVSWMVSALALGGLLVIACLYPVREQENNKVITFISRWFGLLILPLLLLMTIGIFRRIGDYGMTINRGYILLLNLWFYGIYIYLFFSQSRHIKWILISFVAVALASSISVWGVVNITKNSLIKEVSVVLNKPVSSEEAQAIFAEMPHNERDRIGGALEYLHKNFGKESVQPFFTDAVPDSYWRFSSDMTENRAFKEESESFSYYAHRERAWAVGGFNTFAQVSYSDYRRKDGAALKKDAIDILSNDRTFSIPVRDVVLEYLAADKNSRNEREWRVQGDDYMLLITEFYGDCYPEKDSVFINSLDGYLFYETKAK